MNTITSTINKVEETMSKWLTGVLALIETVAAGDADDTATKKAVDDLTDRVNSDEADESELKQAFEALVSKLAVSTPPADGGSVDTGSTATGGESNN